MLDTQEHKNQWENKEKQREYKEQKEENSG